MEGGLLGALTWGALPLALRLVGLVVAVTARWVVKQPHWHLQDEKARLNIEHVKSMAACS